MTPHANLILSVCYIDEIFSQHPANITAVRGNDVTFSCSLLSGNGIVWQHFTSNSIVFVNSTTSPGYVHNSGVDTAVINQNSTWQALGTGMLCSSSPFLTLSLLHEAIKITPKCSRCFVVHASVPEIWLGCCSVWQQGVHWEWIFVHACVLTIKCRLYKICSSSHHIWIDSYAYAHIHTLHVFAPLLFPSFLFPPVTTL